MNFNKHVWGVCFISVFIIFMVCSVTAFAQFKTEEIRALTTWSYTYGNYDYNVAHSIKPTSDGGYIVAGPTRAYGSGEYDFWILKLNVMGGIEWQKAIGGYSDEYTYNIEQTKDGGYVMIGCYASNNKGGYYDVWVIKLDAGGNIEWQKAYGSANTDYGWEIHQLVDEGYILAGKYGTVNCLNCKVLVIRLDSNGEIIWQKIMANAIWNENVCVQKIKRGNYLVTGNVNTVGSGGFDIWLAELDSNGNIIWQKAYGGPSDDFVYIVRESLEGGYLLVGKTKSFGAGDFDAFVMKLDENGNIMWQKTYGGSAYERGWILEQLNPRFGEDCHGYILGGDTYSFGTGYSDMWILKLDGNGNIIWQKSYGGAGYDGLLSLNQAKDGGYIVSGWTISFGAGFYDYWVLKLNQYGTLETPCEYIKDTNIIPANAQFIAVDTYFTAMTSDLTVQVTYHPAIDTPAIPSAVCGWVAR